MKRLWIGLAFLGPVAEPAGVERFVVTAHVRPASDEALTQLRDGAAIEGIGAIGAIGAGTGDPTVAVRPTLDDAIAFVAKKAFATALPYDPDALVLDDAPVPGGAWAHARLHALTITRMRGEDPQPSAWPADPHAIAAAAAPTWHVAALMIDKAPVFAAPAAALPPAAESHARIDRHADVFVLGHIDRCTADAQCLRWAQIVARTDDRFVFGYVPAFWLAAADAWAPSADRRPRAQLVRGGIAGRNARFVLLARDRDGALHRRPVLASRSTEGFPKARIRVDAPARPAGAPQPARVVIAIDGAPPIELPLDATLDARPEDL